MNHEIICFLWAAFNTGADRLTMSVGGRRRERRDVTFKVTEQRRGARVKYDRASIYSHGWWEMARFVSTRAGRVVLRRSDSYSKSTGRHFWHVDRALEAHPHIRVFSFPIGRQTSCLPDRAGADALNSYRERITEAFNKALRARLPESAEQYIACAGRLSDEMREMIAAFELDAPLWADPFESDTGRREELERKLTELGIRTGRAINVYWRQP